MKIGILLMTLLLGAGAVPAQQAPGAQALPSAADSTTHGQEFKWDCSLCHTPDDWRALRPVLEFDHAETGYTLKGAHAGAGCRECHVSPVFRQIGVLCADCHTDVVHRGELGFNCERCHNEASWTQSANLLLEHQQTRFPLLGRHAITDCDACHTTVQKDEFVGLALECTQCHIRDYTATQSPNHQALGISTGCQNCHSMMDLRWTDVVFQHPASFPLALGHNVDDCVACHGSWQTVPDGQDCFACHDDDYRAVSQPSHLANAFPIDCRECHDVAGFSGPDFYSHASTGFPGFGGHSGIGCTACHPSDNYTTLDPACFGCHSSEYYGTDSPDHQVVGFPTNCEQCHTPDGWHIVSPKASAKEGWR